MFLLNRIDLIALIGLFVQAFIAWVFVVILDALCRKASDASPFRSFFRAFLALALGLTILSYRFFQTHDAPTLDARWLDGRWRPTLCYMAYEATKGLFGLALIQGSYALAGRTTPRLLNRVSIAVIILLSASPCVFDDVTVLLIVQAPVMVACAVASLAAFRGVRTAGPGKQVVRSALVGLAVSWTIHALAASTIAVIPLMRYALGINSLIDLAVQLTLGTGLVICVLEETHRRWQAAEAERERLQKALDRDEKLRALGTLVSGVAHELNNPLTVILGYAELLATSGHQGDPARTIGEQAERCRGIVRNLSALASPTRAPFQDLSVAELLERVVRGFDLDRRGEVSRIRVADLRGLRVTADRVGMEQVVTNLLTNALQAGPAGTPVRVDGWSERSGVVLTVTDEGPGVPEDIRSRLFEPFFTTKAPGKGTGLGLSIAHAIVRSHHGTLSVEDAAGGGGALFRLWIPHRKPESVAPPAPLPSSVASGRLFVIDDDHAVRSVIRKQAETRGWSVDEVGSAEAALASSEKLAAADAVLCDLRMPGLGGVGFHDRLSKEAPELLERVIFVTGDLASVESVRFSKRCRRPLVQKPFCFDDLFAALPRRAAAAAR